MNWHDAEMKITNILKRHGGRCTQGTRQSGKTDIVCNWKGNQGWRVQVKYTNDENRMPEWPDSNEMGDLKMTATKNNQVPIVGFVNGSGETKLYYANTKEKVTKYPVEP